MLVEVEAAAWDEPAEVWDEPADHAPWGTIGCKAATWSPAAICEEAPAPLAFAATPLTAAGEAADREERDGITEDVIAWLAELKLQTYKEAVLAWCDEMGAASLEEVVESADDLVEAVELKDSEVRRLRLQAAEALAKVRERGGVCSKSEREIATSGDAQAVVQPVQSFYASHSASTTMERSSASCSSSAHGEGQPASSQLASVGGVDVDGGDGGDDDSVYLKRKPTQTATWTPTVKPASQKLQKKLSKQGSKGQGQLSTNADAEEAEAQRRREEAERRLKQELEDEARLKVETARSTLTQAREEAEPDRLRRTISEVERQGLLPASEIAEAREALLTLVRERQRRYDSAVCRLQAVLDEPRGPDFGQQARESLESAADARNAQGGDHVVEALEAALTQWEVAERRREEASMVLHFALGHATERSLQTALDEARQFGLDCNHSLFAEASKALEDIQKEALAAEAKRIEDEAAAERLREAMEAEDIDSLEAAVQECSSRSLPLRGADGMLQSLRAVKARRDKAATQIHQAMEGDDVVALQRVLTDVGACGVEDGLREAAEARVRELEVAAKRRHNATVELHLATTSGDGLGDARRLEAAVAEGRRWRVDAETLQYAQEALDAARAAERHCAAMLDALRAAAAGGEARPLRAALAAAELASAASAASGEEAAGARALEAARERLLALEAGEKRMEDDRLQREVEASLRSAIEAGDWLAIEACQGKLRELAVAEDCELLTSAAFALEALHEARELAEARRAIEATAAKLGELTLRENALSGPANKKDRSAIGKEIMRLKADEDYLSAARFLKNPVEERKRREVRRAATEKRHLEASQELEAAISEREEAKVEALLAEGALGVEDAESARVFLAVEELRREVAEPDAAVLEFSYAGLERRAFFQASIGMNDFFTELYSLQEGSDFKLKVVGPANSVLVVFRSKELAESVRSSAASLASSLDAAHRAAVVSSAKVRAAIDISDSARSYLPALRQECALMQQRAQSAAESAASEVANAFGRTRTAPATGLNGRTPPATASLSDVARTRTTATPSPVATARAAAPAPTTSAPLESTPAARLLYESAHGAATAPPDVAWPALPSSAPTPVTSSVSSCYPAKGKSKGGATAPAAPAKGDVLPLPREAVALLQRDKEKAASLHGDLRTFAARFHVAAALQAPHYEAVVMQPLGFVHQEAMRQAREELDHLLRHHFDFPLERPKPVEAEGRRRAYLRVDPESGAGIEITHAHEGYLVDEVDEHPGQDFVAGDLLVEIDGVCLAGLSEEELEEAFAGCFADGAQLVVVAGTMS